MSPKRTAITFTVVVLLVAAVSIAVPDKLQIAGFGTPGSDSAEATEALHDQLGYDPEPGIVVVARGDARLDDSDGHAAVADVQRQLAQDPSVVEVRGPFGEGGSQLLLSRDRRSALVIAHFQDVGEHAAAPAIERIRDGVRSDRLDLSYGSFPVGFVDDNEIVREDLLKAELIAFPILALLLLFVFRGIVPASIPLVIGGLSVLGTFACLRLLSQVMDVSVYSLNLATAVGLGLAVDYGLFLVSRYREESARGEPDAARRATMATAGRAVLYSGAIVAIACVALVAFPQQFIYSMGIGGALTAILSSATALLVVPALLPFVKPVQGRTENPTSGGWYRFSNWVMRHAVLVAIASALVLLALAIPATKIDWTFLDRDALPPELESHQVSEAIASDFEPWLEFPISVAFEESDLEEPPRRLQAQIAALPGAGYVADYQSIGDGVGFLQLLPREPPLSDASQQLIRDVRGLVPDVLVGGRTADYVDLQTSIADRSVPALAWIIVMSLVILFLLTGSVVLAVKALVMNSLTLFAVFGLLVVIFQDGLFDIRSLIGFTGPSAIETTIGVVVIATTIGLATDYTVLLLSRIREEHDAGRPNDEAVALGMQRSGKVITSAALLFAVAMLALASSRVFLVQELAVGIALGVLIDATLVRACLVPALMRILGDANWWAPRRLQRAHAWLDERVARAFR